MNLSSPYLTEKPVKRLLIIDNSQTFQLSFQPYNLPKLLKLLPIHSSFPKKKKKINNSYKIAKKFFF